MTCGGGCCVLSLVCTSSSASPTTATTTTRSTLFMYQCKPSLVCKNPVQSTFEAAEESSFQEDPTKPATATTSLPLSLRLSLCSVPTVKNTLDVCYLCIRSRRMWNCCSCSIPCIYWDNKCLLVTHLVITACVLCLLLVVCGRVNGGYAHPLNICK